MGRRLGRHEGRARRDARRSARTARRAGGRRHLRVLRPRGGGVACTAASASSFATVPTCSTATSRCSANPPTARIEAGCQGTMRVRVTLRGARAHTARAWMGRNAIHRARPAARRARGLRATPAGDRRAASSTRRCQAVAIEGGVSGNVVPDSRRGHDQSSLRPRPQRGRGRGARARGARPAPRATATPSRSSTSPPRPPLVDHPLVAALIARNDLDGARQAGLDRRRPLRRGAACRRPTSVPATPPSPTPPRSTCHRDSLERTWRVSTI